MSAWPRLAHASEGAEHLFLERYEQLLIWALQLTGQQAADAEDLVHDAFVEFTAGHEDERAIHNLNGYLYGMLRNMQRARRRRAQRHPVETSLSLDHELPRERHGKVTFAPADRLQAQQELERIATYARTRAGQSKTGAVLLLRFFHGYAPHEIAEVMRVAVRNVDDWLKLARREARLAVNATPGAVEHAVEAVPKKRSSIVHLFTPPTCVEEGAPAGGVVQRLRARIFERPHARCFSSWRLRRLYRADAPPLDARTLAEIVTCPICLNRVSERLGLPSLSDRHPADMLGPTSREAASGARLSRKTLKAGMIIVLIGLAIALGTKSPVSAAELWHRVKETIQRVLGRANDRPALPPVATPMSFIASPARPVAPPVMMPPLPMRPAAIVDPAHLVGVEVEALARLQRAGALMGEQVAIERRGLRIRIEALVESAERQRELEVALGSLREDRRVDLRITNAQQHVRPTAIEPDRPLVWHDIAVVRDRIAADDHLRRFFTMRREGSALTADQSDVDERIRAYADRVLSRSREARYHALALQRLSHRFEPTALHRLNPDAFVTWQALITTEARALASLAELIRLELAPIFSSDPLITAPAVQATLTNVDTTAVADRVVHLTRAVHDAVRAAVTASAATGGAGLAIETDTFWRDLSEAEMLARTLSLRRHTP